MIRLINKYGPLKFFTGLITLLCLAYLLASCGTIKKSYTHTTATTDSTHLKKSDSIKSVTVDSGHLVRKDSTGVKADSSESSTELVITVDTSYKGSDYPPTENDYREPQEGHENKISVRVDSTGSVDVNLGRFRPLKIEVKQKNTRSTRDSSRLATVDSSFFKRKDTTAVATIDSGSVKKTKTDVSKSTQKFRVPFMLQLCIVLFTIIFFLLTIYAIYKHIRRQASG